MPQLKKRHIKLGHAGIADHSVDLSIPDLKKKKKTYKKRIDRSDQKNYINAQKQVPKP